MCHSDTKTAEEVRVITRRHFLRRFSVAITSHNSNLPFCNQCKYIMWELCRINSGNIKCKFHCVVSSQTLEYSKPWGRGQMLPQYCFYLRRVSLGTDFKDGQIKEIWVRLRERGCMSIKDRFKTKFPLLKIWPLKPTVDFFPPPPHGYLSTVHPYTNYMHS